MNFELFEATCNIRAASQKIYRRFEFQPDSADLLYAWISNRFQEVPFVATASNVSSSNMYVADDDIVQNDPPNSSSSVPERIFENYVVEESCSVMQHLSSNVCCVRT